MRPGRGTGRSRSWPRAAAPLPHRPPGAGTRRMLRMLGDPHVAVASPRRTNARYDPPATAGRLVTRRRRRNGFSSPSRNRDVLAPTTRDERLRPPVLRRSSTQLAVAVVSASSTSPTSRRHGPLSPRFRRGPELRWIFTVTGIGGQCNGHARHDEGAWNRSDERFERSPSARSPTLERPAGAIEGLSPSPRGTRRRVRRIESARCASLASTANVIRRPRGEDPRAVRARA